MNKNTLDKKIFALNTATLRAMSEEDNIVIIKNFTEQCIKIFDADFGFAVGKFNMNDEHQLVYKSAKTPADAPSTKTKNYLMIPISYGDHMYGSITLGYAEHVVFAEEDLALRNTAGNAIAQSITVNWLVESEAKARALAEKQKETEVLLSQEKVKSEFIANATHELRTPLAIIKGNLDLAQTKNKYIDLYKDVFPAIDEEVKRLTDIISDLAMMTAKVNRGGNTEPISYGKINLKTLIDTVVRRCQTLSTEKNITVEAKNIPKVSLYGNEPYLDKMFMNLVKNSLTYGTPNGHTTLTASATKNFIKVNVADNGIGIGSEDVEHIFERFYRADKSHNRDGNRTGLGLAIVKWVAETHGGSVEVKSKKGKGSTFTVKLPIDRRK